MSGVLAMIKKLRKRLEISRNTVSFVTGNPIQIEDV